jgi:hypothetical protein
LLLLLFLIIFVQVVFLMNRLYTPVLIALFSCAFSKSYATDGCYSLLSARFYYVSIGTNNYSGLSYAVASTSASCSTFSAGTYTATLCNIQGTSNPSYRQATTDLVYPCPIDDDIPILATLIAMFGFTVLSPKLSCLNFINGSFASLAKQA